MSFHQNNGHCPGCETLFSKFPNFHRGLKSWFQTFQSDYPEAHISCAGRGRVDQDEAFIKHLSKAHWGDSAHNYNCAIDIFHNNGINLYSKEWYENILKPNLPDWVRWYGEPDAIFFELPHVELKDWKELKKSGAIILVA